VIVKYYEGKGTWSFIDRINKTSVTNIVKEDIGDKSAEEIAREVKKYKFGDNIGIPYENCVQIFKDSPNDKTIAVIEMHREINREADQDITEEYRVIITNTTAYLLENNGKTIERLV
jgi:hypothetical protein